MSLLKSLEPAPTHIETFGEIAVLYNQELPDLYNKLTSQERIFAYYLFRASLPGNIISSDQMHRDALMIKKIFETIVHRGVELKALAAKNNSHVHNINLPVFLREARIFLVYLWGSHSQYFARESANEKRTPQRLGLLTLTKENLINVCQALEITDFVFEIERIEQSIFDYNYEPTLTIPNSIESSAVNFYSQDFTENDYQSLPPEDRDKLNAYFSVESVNGQRHPISKTYAVHGKYATELDVAVFWLKKAMDHASNHPTYFDHALVKSLDFLVQYLESGDEDLFKKHSIEWLKSNSRIDYNFGFIETYHDPKAKRGTFQAEATIKSLDLGKLNKILPKLEEALPFPAALKRSFSEESTHAMPNASMNTKIFGTGALGPMLITAAYCLPNYEEIRTTHGSKQIIYPGVKGLDALINPGLSHKLFYLPHDAEMLEEIDPEWNFFNDLWNVQCILHETLGHGSGKLATHTFKKNAPISIIGGKTYTEGQSIAVTHENLPELLLGYEATIEELRAEIIALYASVKYLDEIIKAGFLTTWYQKIGKSSLSKWLILYMANTALTRHIQQNDDAFEITGDHARANCTITNYLIKSGALALKEAVVEIDNAQHAIVALDMLDSDKALDAITKLMQEVQRIKSTGDGSGAQQLIDTYGKPLNKQHLKILKANEKVVTGNLKARVYIYPHFEPVLDENGNYLDINAHWPSHIFDQYQKYGTMALSKA